jgi:hypothetical protein
MRWRLVLSLEPFKNRRQPTCAISAYRHAFERITGRWLGWLSGAGLAVLLAAAWPFSVDDAYIVVRYASRLAAGQGYTFADGPPTDGVTGPLWLLPLWVGARLGVAPLSLAKLLGGASAVLAVARMVSRVHARALGRLAAPIAAALCLSSVPLVIWPIAGLETGLAVLFATELALAVTASGRPQATRAGVCAGILAWLRPELALWALVLLGAQSVRAPQTAWKSWSYASALVLLVLSFRLVMFGHALPMSGAAKPPSLGHGFDYFLATCARLDVLLTLALLAVACARLRSSSRAQTRSADTPTRRSWLLAALSAHALAVCLAGGDWMPGFRLFAPVVPVFAWVVAEAFARLWLAHRGAKRAAAALAVCVVLALRGVLVLQEVALARAAGFERIAAIPALKHALRGVRGTIAALDIGILGYVYEGPILDLAGLTEPRIAYAPGGHLAKHVDSAWLRSRTPALILLHSDERPRLDADGHVRWFRGYPVERRVLAMPWVMQDYRASQLLPYNPSYYYVLLTLRAGTPNR